MHTLIMMIRQEDLLKLAIAAMLSLIIGIERELKKKPVGLKTSLVISTFSCLLTIISIDTAYNTPPRDEINITMDPLRLAAQIVSGIGFLGAGVILRRGNDSITGLTTAAIIWGAAGIGIAVGAGFYLEAIVTVLIVVVGIKVVAPFLMKIGPKRIRMRELSLKAGIAKKENIEDLLKFMENNGMVIDNIRISGENLNYEVNIRFSTLLKKNTYSIFETFHALPYIQKIEIEILS
ncbi:MgtC/SapB family protein [Ureibacillus sp. FSL K6-8385]|uniref:MgtC/SapB family protein n=1 Tax=Ureibacillus terrenus TaxID=118246 RepID=A0A540V0F1_9BACL|nr:MgtC/SapB family protein [Ureibacillus terrenus]MED3662903.1 MgtC/SapB family protein [Ureibacillus terrenus]MED3764876.1 MgtC/SapB family protein [Ureibacillus terrenus]TQE90232.1 MgtC/SapB family protein [Ureibacillus terrenus]